MKKIKNKILSSLEDYKIRPLTEIKKIVKESEIDSIIMSMVESKEVFIYKYQGNIYFYKEIVLNKKYSNKKTITKTSRSCFTHLAGAMGVNLRKNLESAEFLYSNNLLPYKLTKEGVSFFNSYDKISNFNINDCGIKCVDRTERELHIGGRLGEKIFNFLIEKKCIKRVNECRDINYYIANKKYEFLFRDTM